MVDNELSKVIEEFSGVLGVAARDLTTGRQLNFNEDRAFPTASAIKIIVMVDAFRQAREGTLDLLQKARVDASDTVGGSGVLATLTPGASLPVIDYVELMMTISDNTATNVLVRMLGLESINQTATMLGMRHTTLYGPVSFEKVGGKFKTLGTTTPRDAISLLERLARREVVDSDSSDKMIEIMKRQQDLAGFPRYLPFNPFAETLGASSTMWVANKTGTMPGIRSDIGLIGDDKGVIALALFSEGCRDLTFSVDNEGTIVLARVGKLVYEAFRG